MIDGHAHPFDLRPGPFDLRRLAIDLSETEPGAPPEGPVPHLWRALVRARLAARLGVDPDDVAAARAEAAADYPAYVRGLFADAGVEGIILDPSWPPGSATHRAEFEATAGCPVHLVFRLEPVVDDLLGRGLPFEEIVRDFDAALAGAVASGCVGLKSALAYRTGLAVDAQAGEAAARASLRDRGPLRRRAKPLRDLLLRRALAFAADHRLPLQVHTGFGDSDLRLAEANPLHLEDLLRTPEGTSAPIVLLHSGFPFQDEAAFLAAARPNVHVDVSLVNVFAPVDLAGALVRLTRLAPPQRVLVGTDAYALPEVFWVAATLLAEAWEHVAREYVDLGLSAHWVAGVRELVFTGNARRLYGLP